MTNMLANSCQTQSNTGIHVVACWFPLKSNIYHISLKFTILWASPKKRPHAMLITEDRAIPWVCWNFYYFLWFFSYSSAPWQRHEHTAVYKLIIYWLTFVLVSTHSTWCSLNSYILHYIHQSQSFTVTALCFALVNKIQGEVNRTLGIK